MEFLDGLISVLSHVSNVTVKHGDGGVMWIWTTCHIGWYLEFCSLPEILDLERPSICSCSKAQEHLSSRTVNQTSKSTSETNEGFGMAESKSRCKTAWDNLAWPLCLKSHNLEFKQFCKEEWAKIPPQGRERFIASYHIHLIAVLTGQVGKTSC